MRNVIADEIQRVVNKLEADIKAKAKTFKEISHDAREWSATLIKRYINKGQKDVAHDIQGLQIKLLDCLEMAKDLLLYYSWHMYLSRPPRIYKALAIDKETYNYIKQCIDEYPEARNISVAEVVQEALRRKIEEFKRKKDTSEGP